MTTMTAQAAQAAQEKVAREMAKILTMNAPGDESPKVSTAALMVVLLNFGDAANAAYAQATLSGDAAVADQNLGRVDTCSVLLDAVTRVVEEDAQTSSLPDNVIPFPGGYL